MIELFELVENCKIFNKNLYLSLRWNKTLSERIKKATSFLSETSTMQERVYCLINELKQVPLCKVCAKKEVKFGGQNKNYNLYCSNSCLGRDPEVQALKKSKRNEIEINRKREQTLLKTTGFSNASHNPKIKKQLSDLSIERYADPLRKKEIVEKFEKTNKDKTGYSNPAQVPEYQKKSKQTNLKNHGRLSYHRTEECRKKSSLSLQAPEVRAQTKQTCLEKYNVDNTFKLPNSIENRKQSFVVYGGSPFHSKEIREKGAQTLIEKYGSANFLLSNSGKKLMIENFGTENYFSSEVGKQTIKQIHLEKRGVEFPMQDSAVQEKSKKTNIERIGVPYPLQLEKIKEQVRRKKWEKFYDSTSARSPQIILRFKKEDYKGNTWYYLMTCSVCGADYVDHFFGGRQPRCLSCYPIEHFKSHYEDEIVSWLNEIGILSQEVIRNDRRVLEGKEIDVYLPNFKLGIEFNGLWAHSDGDDKDGRIDQNYHLNKTDVCERKGIKLIHIFEDEWLEKQKVVKSIIKNRLGLSENKIHARKCLVKAITGREVYDFLYENHLNTPIVRKHNFGLYYQDALVYVLSIGEARSNKDYQYEIVRSCAKIDTSVIGGFSKLVKYASDSLKIQSMISYVDRRYFSGDGYKDWTLLKKLPPSYEYVDPTYQTRENRRNYQKKQIAKKFPEIYNSELTEEMMMSQAGYHKIWNCGLLAFSLKNS